MNECARLHPVFISHTKELEQMLTFAADLQERIRKSGQDTGEKYECLLNVRKKCQDLLLRMYAEETNIILMNDDDHRWVQKIVRYVHEHILKDIQKAG